MYFNLNSMGNKDKKFRRRRNIYRYRSANRIFVSNTEMKHFNDKIIITIYTYNRTKKYIFKLLEKLYKKIFRNFFVNTWRVKKFFKNNIELINNNNKFFYVNKFIKIKLKKFLNRKYKLRFKLKRKKNKISKKNRLKIRKLRKYYLVKTYKNLYLNNLINYNITNLDIKTNSKQSNRYNQKKINLNKFYLNLKFLSVYDSSIIILKKFLFRSSSIFKLLKEKNIKKLVNKKKLFKLKKDYLKINKEYIKGKLWKEILYLKYNQRLITEGYKYNNIYLNRLKNIIENIYKKNIEFNIINLKYLHLDSKIFSDFMALKLKNRKNKLIRVLKKALVLPKISRSKIFSFNIQNFYIKKYNDLNFFNLDNNSFRLNFVNKFKSDVLHLFLNKLFNLKKTQVNFTKSDILEKRQKFVYKSVRFRKIIGIRFEAKGRLTSRLTASRSIFKLRYKGNLKNIDTVNNISSVIIRGYLKSNLDYSNINSKTRNGCFGLKGWINSK